MLRTISRSFPGDRLDEADLDVLALSSGLPNSLVLTKYFESDIDFDFNYNRDSD